MWQQTKIMVVTEKNKLITTFKLQKFLAVVIKFKDNKKSSPPKWTVWFIVKKKYKMEGLFT